MMRPHKIGLNALICIILIALISLASNVSIGTFGLLTWIAPLLVIHVIIMSSVHKPVIQINYKDIRLYVLYAIIFYLCTLFNGDGNIGRNSLMIQYLVCMMIFIAIYYDITTLSAIRIVINVIIILLLLDCIITILQFKNNSLGWGVWYFFNSSLLNSEEIIKNVTSVSTIQTIGNQTLCPGLFPTQVYNGYMLATAGIMNVCYYPQIKKWRLLNIIILSLTLVSLFVTQQRMAFYIFLIFCAYIYYGRHKAMTIFLVIIGAVFYTYTNSYLTEDYIGRFANSEDRLREQLYDSAIKFISENYLAGGRIAYSNIDNHSAHNVFLNAFLYGGLFGGILILIIYFRMCFKAIRIILRENRQAMSTVLAFGLLSFNIISLTHNNSLLTGEPIIWIIYALMLLSLKYEEQQKGDFVEQRYS